MAETFNDKKQVLTAYEIQQNQKEKVLKDSAIHGK